MQEDEAKSHLHETKSEIHEELKSQDQAIEKESNRTMQSQKTHRIDHITIDNNELSDSELSSNNEDKDNPEEQDEYKVSFDTQENASKLKDSYGKRESNNLEGSIRSKDFETVRGYSTNANTPLRQNSRIKLRFQKNGANKLQDNTPQKIGLKVDTKQSQNDSDTNFYKNDDSLEDRHETNK